MGRGKGRHGGEAAARARNAAPTVFGAARSFIAWVLPTYLSGQHPRAGVSLAPDLPDAAVVSPGGCGVPLLAHRQTGATSAGAADSKNLSQAVRILPTQAQRRVGGGKAGKKTATNEVRSGRSPHADVELSQLDGADEPLTVTRDALDGASMHSFITANRKAGSSRTASSNALHRPLDGSTPGAPRNRDDDSAATEFLMGAPASPQASSTEIRSGLDGSSRGNTHPSNCTTERRRPWSLRPQALSERSEPGHKGRQSLECLEGDGRRPVSLFTKNLFALHATSHRTPNLIPSRVLGLLSGLLVFGALSASTALASESPPQPQPNWRISGEVLPTYIAAGHTGLLLLRVENVGAVPTAPGAPVRVMDRLPPGVEAIHAGALVHDGLTVDSSGLWGECGIADEARMVTCTYQAGATIPPVSLTPGGDVNVNAGPHSLAPPIGIEVSVASEAAGPLTDAATVVGGGAPEGAATTASIDVTESPVPFGVAAFRQWSTTANGAPASQAGGHPYATTTSIVLNSTGSPEQDFGPAGAGVRDLDVELPPGFVGDPNAVPKCPRPEFDSRLNGSFNAECPPDTQVGVAIVYTDPDGLFAEIPVYNLVPPAGVPVQFGLAFEQFAAVLSATVHPNPNGQYSVSVDARDIQSRGETGVTVSFWGIPAESSHDALRDPQGANSPKGRTPSDVAYKPFLRLPTSCGVPQTLAISAASWADPLQLPVLFTGVAASTDGDENTVALEGCERLSFGPSLQLTPDTTATDAPTGIEANLRLPQNEDPNALAEADLKDASVTLPPGWTLSSSAANGLEACSPEEIGLGNERQPTCPAASKIGTLEVATPLLEHPLEGEIYVAQQETVDGSLIGGYLVVDDARTGVLIKLPGRFEVGGGAGVKGLQPGQIRAVFENSPQFPFSDLKLKFFGGPKASLMTPAACGASTATTVMTGWNGSVVTPESNPITTNTGCTQSFSPSFTAGTADSGAGQYSPFTLSLSRTDSEQQLSGLSFTLPPGVAAKLAGVPRCSNAEANAGACPASTQIGTVTVGAGAGPEPLYVNGTMYLTGPYKGAPFGEVVEVPAIAGPFNLDENGRPVVVRGAIRINPNTAQGEVVSDPLPTELRGIQIDERSVQVTVNRSNFIFNPTNCGQLATTGAIRSTAGTIANVSSPFKASGCSKLPFKPVMTISTQPHATKADGASLSVKLSQKSGEANIHKVEIQIPTQLPARLTTLQKACTEKVFEENPATCPKGSVIGTAKAVTPVLSSPLKGPAILVSHGGAAFPDVEFVLQGEGVTIVLDGKTNIKKGITYSKFETVPDAPVTSFEANFPSGPNSIFAAYLNKSSAPDLCGSKLAIPTTMEGQNGSVVKATKSLGITGCPKPKKVKKAKKTKGKAKKASATVSEARQTISNGRANS